MSKVLCIIANPKKVVDSTSQTIYQEFIKSYKEANPNDELVELNLYKEKMQHLQLSDIENMKDAKGNMQKTAKEFASYDKYIFAFPMWNLSIPSILKAYIDHIIVSGVTFQYSTSGMPKGLLKNKKAQLIVSRGGGYSFWPLSMFAFDWKYMKTILSFIGIKDIKLLPVEKTDKDRSKLPDIITKAKSKARRLAKNF